MANDLARLAEQLRAALSTSAQVNLNDEADIQLWMEKAYTWKFSQLQLSRLRYLEYRLANLTIQISDSVGLVAEGQDAATKPAHSLLFQLAGTSTFTPVQADRQQFVVLPGMVHSVFEPEEARIALAGDRLVVRVSVPDQVLRSKFEGLLQRPAPDLTFTRLVDFEQGRLRLLLEQLVSWSEAQAKGALVDVASTIWQMEFEQMLLSNIVLNAPHNRSHLLLQPVRAAAPRNVRRAEAFMKANTGAVLTLEQIASAAGCSPRALQKAFMHFREVTPLGYLRRLRFEAARERLLSGDVQSIGALVQELGISNAGRFAVEFKRLFGGSPADFLKRG